MTTKIDAADLAPIQARVADAAVVAAGQEVAIEALPDESSRDLPAKATEVAATEHMLSVVLADIASDLEALIEGGTVEPPIEPPVPADMILDLQDVVTPIEYPASTFAGTQFVAVVVKVPAGTTYRKLVGADASKGKHGGFCLGITDKNALECWVDDGKGIQQVLTTLRIGKATLYAMAIDEEATIQALSADAVLVTKPLPDGAVDFDGVGAVGKGVWNHQFVDPSLPGVELRRVRVCRSFQDMEDLAEEWADVIDPPDTGNGGGGGNGGNGQTIKVGPGVGSGYLNDLGPGTIVQFAPGIYHNLHITPRDRVTFRGVPGNQAAVVLDGDGTTNGSAGPAFGGHAADVAIQWLTIQNYWGGGPRTLAAGAAGHTEADARSWTNGGVGGIRPASGWNENPAGAGWVMEDLIVRNNLCSGINVSNNSRVSRCHVYGNASCGIDGFADAVTIEDCEIDHNSTWEFNRNIHGGGVKSQAGFSGHKAFRHHLYRRNVIHHNDGDGIWLDFGMSSYEIVNNSIFANNGHALRYEACAGIWAHHNQLGLASADATGHLDSEIYAFQNSGDHVFEDNLCAVIRSIACKIIQDSRGSSVGVNSYPQVGWFDSGCSIVRRNVFLLINAGGRFTVDGLVAAPPGWNASTDPKCSYKSSVLTKATDAYEAPNAFCFWPATLAGMALTIDGNTYRLPVAGQTPTRLNWPSETNAHVIAAGSPELYLPDWTKAPTWDVPPGTAP